MSGDVTKALVLALPSLRFGKLRLKLLTMVLGLSDRCRCGPTDRYRARRRWRSTVPPMASRSASSPSRSMVARTCSEPGVMNSFDLARRPWADACRAMDAARVMSSYDELVHEPIRAAEISLGTPFSRDPGADLIDRVGEIG